jgi:UDP-N-acetylmuramoylalanine--D-glutamate ligase
VNLAGQRIGVAGLGLSGRAAVAALEPLGATLTLIDDAAEGTLPPASVDLSSLDRLVVSPGWAPGSPLLQAARAAELPVWSEVELAWQLRANPAAPWLTLTGTNGKTTTVELLRDLLVAGGARAVAVGNVGNPLVSAVLEASTEVFAVELSSFQLHYTTSVRPLAAALLNVAADHIDWHGSFEAYAADKARVFSGVERFCVYNAADPAARAAALAAVPPGAGGGDEAEPRAVGFTLAAPRLGEIGLVDRQIVDRAFGPERWRQARPLVSLDDLAHLAGPDGRLAPDLVADVLAAIALALAYGTEVDGIGQTLRGFRPGAHRREEIAEISGVRFVDDSKATNAHAAAAALGCFPAGSVVWIAGGLAKGARFESLVARRSDRLKAAVLIGLDHHELTAALAAGAPGLPVLEIAPGENLMERTVAAAAALAEPGDTVLLAPASASMDQFDSYAERGRAFAQAVERLVSADVA